LITCIITGTSIVARGTFGETGGAVEIVIDDAGHILASVAGSGSVLAGGAGLLAWLTFEVFCFFEVAVGADRAALVREGELEVGSRVGVDGALGALGGGTAVAESASVGTGCASVVVDFAVVTVGAGHKALEGGCVVEHVDTAPSI